MKFTTLFVSAAALACSAVAEPVPRMAESHTVRDIAAVQSAVTSVTSAIKALTKSVAEFNGDSIQVEADASALVTALELGVKGIASSGSLDVGGLVGLQTCFTTLTTSGSDLIQKLTVKKSQFEQAGLCTTIEKAMIDVGNKSKDMIKTVCGLLPEQFQGVVQQVGNTVTDVLVKGANVFSESNCIDNPLATTSKSLVPYPTGSLTFSAIAPIFSTPSTKTATVQVTITTCDAEHASTQTSYSIVSPSTPVNPSYLPTTPIIPAPPAASTQTMIVVPVPTPAISSTYLITAPQPAPTPITTTKPVVVVPTTTKPATPTTAIPVAAGPRNSISSTTGLVAAVAVVVAMLL